MVKPSFSSTINEEEVEDRVDLEKQEADVKQIEEEKITESNFLSEGFTCQMEAGPVPEQESGILAFRFFPFRLFQSSIMTGWCKLALQTMWGLPTEMQCVGFVPPFSYKYKIHNERERIFDILPALVQSNRVKPEHMDGTHDD